MKIPTFITENPRLALYALLSVATSGFGQTFFVSILVPEFVLNSSSRTVNYGLYYGLATLCSALLLLKLGGLADRMDLWRVTLLALLLLICGCLLLGTTSHWILLIPGFLLIRLGGQAMLTHLGMTVAGRYFMHNRGRIMALTAAGFPLAEATLPATASLILVNGGWRMAWLLSAVALLLIALPILLLLARHAEHPAQQDKNTEHATSKSLTRGQALRDPGFYLILPATLVTPFTITAILFHQAAIAELRHWPTEVVGLAFTGFAIGHFTSLFLAGPLIDLWGAQRSLPLTLLPLFSGLLVLGLTDAAWTPYLYLALCGATLGAVGAASGALWPERYGARHIGAIRSVAQSVLVFSTAVAPFAIGTMLDAAMSPATVAQLLAAMVAVCAMLMLFTRPADL